MNEWTNGHCQIVRLAQSGYCLVYEKTKQAAAPEGLYLSKVKSSLTQYGLIIVSL